MSSQSMSNDQDFIKFSVRMRHIRESAKLSYADMASEFGKTEAAIRAWESGRTKPDADTLIRLSKYFDCSTDYLLGLVSHRTEQQKEELREQANAFAEEIEKFPPEFRHILFGLIEGFMKILYDMQPPGNEDANASVEVITYINAAMQQMRKLSSALKQSSEVLQKRDGLSAEQIVAIEADFYRTLSQTSQRVTSNMHDAIDGIREEFVRSVKKRQAMASVDDNES